MSWYGMRVRRRRGPGFMGMIPGVLIVFAVLAAPLTAFAAQAETALTFASGSTVTWQEPWKGPQIDGNRSVYLGNATASGFLVTSDPVAQVTPDVAVVPPNESYEVLDLGEDGQGGWYALAGLQSVMFPSNEEVVMVVFRRAWTSPDGQWTIVTQLDTMLENLEQDLASVPLAVAIDGTPVWDDIDPAILVSAVESWVGGSAPAAPAAAQSAPETTSSGQELTPLEIADSMQLENGTSVGWSALWSKSEEQSADNFVTLDGLLTGKFFVQDYGDHMTLEDTWATTRDAFGQGAQLIDEGQSPDGGYYGLWVAVLPDGTEIYVMARATYAPGTTTPMSTGAYMYATSIDVGLIANHSVAINGQRAWMDIDELAIAAIFANRAPTGVSIFRATAASQPVPAAEHAPPAAADTAPATEPKPQQGSASQTSAGDTYESPQFGYLLEWSSDWVIFEGSEVSDLAQGYDSVTLSTTATGSGAINVYGAAWDGSLTIADVIEYWSSDDYLAEYQPGGTSVVLKDSGRSSGAVVLVGPYSDDDPEKWVTVMEIVLIGRDVEVEAMLVAPLADFEAVYEETQQTVDLDGVAVIGYFSTEEILAALP